MPTRSNSYAVLYLGVSTGDETQEASATGHEEQWPRSEVDGCEYDGAWPSTRLLGR